MSEVKRGDRYSWSGVAIDVIRVAKDGTWAHIRCSSGIGPRSNWMKRQPLPFPVDFDREESTDGLAPPGSCSPRSPAASSATSTATPPPDRNAAT